MRLATPFKTTAIAATTSIAVFSANVVNAASGSLTETLQALPSTTQLKKTVCPLHHTFNRQGQEVAHVIFNSPNELKSIEYRIGIRSDGEWDEDTADAVIKNVKNGTLFLTFDGEIDTPSGGNDPQDYDCIEIEVAP